MTSHLSPFFDISLFIHILSVIAWLSTLPIATVIGKAAETTSVTEDKFKILKYSSVNTIISVGAGLLVFLSGAMMTTILGEWSPRTGMIWLVAKQTIWIIIFVGGILLMRPALGKMNKQIDENANPEEVMETFKKLKIRGHVFTTLIIVNIILVVFRPF